MCGSVDCGGYAIVYFSKKDVTCVLCLFCLCSVCFLYVFCLCSVCVLYVFCLCSVCFLSVFCIYSVCFLSVFCMCSVCVLSVFRSDVVCGEVLSIIQSQVTFLMDCFITGLLVNSNENLTD
jgi:hypothetical protein